MSNLMMEIDHTACLRYLIKLDIKIAWDEFKLVLHPDIFGGHNSTYIYCSKMEQKTLHYGWDLCQKIF